MEKLEPGLTFVDKEARLPSSIGTTGFIDLLAQDSEGRYVLIEVKKSGPATRETLHEIVKYIENAKSHLGLRENELRVIIASVEWRELMVPFSSFVSRTSCRVEGYRLEINDTGTVIDAEAVEPVSIESDRVLAPWHELRFYADEQRLIEGIESYERACDAKEIQSYVLLILDPPEGNPDGFPSTKQMTNRAMLAAMAAEMGKPVKDAPMELYRGALYFATQQLSRDEYISRLPMEEPSTVETLEAISNMGDEEALGTLHEAVLDLQPRPTSAFFEIGYPAKFRSRLLEDEGWSIREIRRYGYFRRNMLLSDDTIVQEIGGAQGNSKQSMKMSFRPNQKAEVAEVRRRIDECLCDNEPWRSQINFVLNELAHYSEDRQCYIQIMNPCSAITTIYLSASRDDGFLYVPTYQIRVPEDDTELMYYGALQHNGSKPFTLKQVVDTFYDGQINQMLFTLQWGGYESRDVKIVRKLGLRYKTFKALAADGDRQFFKLDDHQWEASEAVDPLDTYLSFLRSYGALTSEVLELYASRWDGRMVNFYPDD
ncbi:MAG: hypothetical protein JHD35_27045 [Sphingopyxis sp.]|nr:hypothetical protein [Sphingopyxis sp.]